MNGENTEPKQGSSKENILSHKLFIQQEELSFHLPYEKEMTFYDYVKYGDFDGVKKTMAPLTSKKLGTLSKNPVRNLKYHLIITIAMITRFCIEGGMPPESAYTLSDIYIQQLDVTNDIEAINQLHREVIYDFTDRMQKIKKRKGISRTVTKAADYIYNHLNEKIKLEELSSELGVNKTYLCELFKKETGSTIYNYITKLKIEAAEKMLIYTDYSPSDISNYFAFSSHSHFITIFKKNTGNTPSEYRKQHFRQYFDMNNPDSKSTTPDIQS